MFTICQGERDENMGWIVFFKMVLVISCMSGTHTALIDGELLAKEFKTIARDGMGVTNMQNFYDSQTYDKKNVSGPQLLEQISENLSKKFQELIQAATRIRNIVEEEYPNFPQEPLQNGIEQCCQASDVKNDTKFGPKVKLGESCVTKSSTSPPDSKFPNKKVEETMKDNYDENNNLLWQHFGSEDGTSMYYPKVKADNCEDNDPRESSYYSSAASSKPKDVVIVFDKSSSMLTTDVPDQTRMYIAKEIAETVVDTLNQNDRIGIIAFSNDVTRPGDLTDLKCFKETLAIATNANKEEMKGFTKRLQNSQGKNFGAALRSAFQYFSSSLASLNGETRDQMILLLTDGGDVTGTENPLDVIKAENEKLQNRIYVMTFGIGKDIKSEQSAMELLKNMSHQVLNNASYGTVKIGFSQHIEDGTNLRSKMSVYYEFFRYSQNQNPSLSVPYLDTFSKKGLVISLCLPAYKTTTLLGVACADMKLNDIFAEVNVFKEGDLSYIFVIDNFGRTLHHPLLQLPRTLKEDIPVVDIYSLERSKEAKAVIQSMISRETGNMTFESTRTVARGKVLYDGIFRTSIQSHYFWKPIANSSYSLCVVVGDGDIYQTLQHQTPKDEVFLYHRRDLLPDNLTDCEIVKRWSTKERAAIHFNTFAFKNPSLYIDYEETRDDVLGYKTYFTSVGAKNPGFKMWRNRLTGAECGTKMYSGAPAFTFDLLKINFALSVSDVSEDSIYNSLIATYEAEKFWKEHTDLATFAIWRYIGTKDGVFRTFPHHIMPKDYDHELRPWWRRTAPHKGVLIVTTPYVDASGSGLIAALCHSIYKGSKTGHTKEDKVEAVICWDVSLQYLHHLLLKKYPICGESQYTCMLVDDSGFVVIHPDFVDPNIDKREVQYIHLVVKESGIAKNLIEQGIMTGRTCTNLENYYNQHTYRVALLPGTHDVIRESSTSTVEYELQPVSGTNVFIIIKKTLHSAVKCCEGTFGKSPDVVRCKSRPFGCDCLCYEKIPVNQCLQRHNLSSDMADTCIAKAPGSKSEVDQHLKDLEEKKIEGLPPCYDTNCSSRTSEFDCYKIVGCSWCVRQKDGKFCDKPYCSALKECPFGVLSGSQSCFTTTTMQTDSGQTKGNDDVNTATKQEEDKFLIALVIFLAVLTVFLLSVVIIVICRNVTKSKHNPRDDYLTAESTESVTSRPPAAHQHQVNFTAVV